MNFTRPILIFLAAVFLFFSINAWKDNFSQNPAKNKWALTNGVITLVPDTPINKQKEKDATTDGKQFDLE